MYNKAGAGAFVQRKKVVLLLKEISDNCPLLNGSIFSLDPPIPGMFYQKVISRKSCFRHLHKTVLKRNCGRKPCCNKTKTTNVSDISAAI